MTNSTAEVLRITPVLERKTGLTTSEWRVEPLGMVGTVSLALTSLCLNSLGVSCVKLQLQVPLGRGEIFLFCNKTRMKEPLFYV